MFALLRVTVLLAIAMTIVYWCLLFYLRAGERARLEARWRAERPPLPRDRFVQIGLDDYGPTLRRRLIWAVYVVPGAVIAALVWYNNSA
jgi:hypothetical protein